MLQRLKEAKADHALTDGRYPTDLSSNWHPDGRRSDVFEVHLWCTLEALINLDKGFLNNSEATGIAVSHRGCFHSLGDTCIER
jgi:hypothetical protein